MSVPEGSLVVAVERMARALEQLASAPSVRAMLEELARSAVSILDAALGSASWLDDDGSLHTCVTPGLPEDVATATAILLLRQEMGTPEAPRPYVASPLRSSALLAAEPTLVDRLGAQALVASPIFVSEGTRVGVLVGWFREPSQPTEDQVRRFGLYSRLAGIALARDRMVEEARRSVVRARSEAEQAEVLRLSRFQAVTEGFSRALTRREVARVVVDLGLSSVGALAGTVHMATLDGGPVELVASAGLEPDTEEVFRRPPLEGDTPGHDVARTGSPVWLESPEDLAARYPELAAGRSMASHQAFAFLPVMAEGKVMGVVGFGFGAPRRFNVPEQSSMLGLARQCGLALERALLYEREHVARLQAEASGRRMRLLEEDSRQSAARLHLLVRVSQLVAEAGLNLPQVLDVLAREVAEAIGDGCILQLVSEDGQWLEPAAVHHPDAVALALLETPVRAQRVRVGEGLQGAALSTGHTLRAASLEAQAVDAAGPDAALRPYLERQGPQGLIVVALVAHGRACGSLLVLRGAQQPYGEDDQVLLESIASRAALAIDDARLYAAALQALRIRDDFLSVAGHELKSPLNALLLQLRVLVRLAREPSGSERLAERVERLAHTGERLGLLMDDLLDVSRLSTGQLQLRRAEVDLAVLAREGVLRMAEVLARAGCEVRVEAEEPVVGRWDKLRLEQVVMNLLSNAAKYGQGRPVRVRVEAAPGLARLAVSDEGYGIGPEDQERIFQRFHRAESTRHIQGLGLGLWISRQIAESHGGTLRVESVEGQGSTFLLELPREAPKSGLNP